MKKPYSTKRQAIRALKETVRGIDKYVGGKVYLAVYRCPECSRFHIGNDVKEREKTQKPWNGAKIEIFAPYYIIFEK